MHVALLVLISYAHKPLLNALADLSRRIRGRNFGFNLHLHSNFLHDSSKGSGKSTQLYRLAIRTFLAQECDKYQNLMCKLIYGPCRGKLSLGFPTN